MSKLEQGDVDLLVVLDHWLEEAENVCEPVISIVMNKESRDKLVKIVEEVRGINIWIVDGWQTDICLYKNIPVLVDDNMETGDICLDTAHSKGRA